MRVHHLNCGTLCPHGARLLRGAGGWLERHEIVCHCLLVEGEGELVLVDTGFGSDDASDPSRLGQPFRMALQPRPVLGETAVRQVEALGFDPADVRHVVATHLDPDHAGGLPDFPGAEVHVLAAELAAALHPRLRDRSRYLANRISHGPRWAAHGPGGEEWFGFASARILPGLDAEVLLVPLIGHSRGHTGVAIRDGERWLLHCGDAYFDRGQVATPPTCPPGLRLFQRLTAFDHPARVANTERLRELAADHGDEVDLFCSHDPRELRRRRLVGVAGAAVEAT